MGWLKECERLFSKEVFDKLMNLLNTIPDSNHLLHCDFHVKNIMAQKNELLLVDMESLSVGHPIFEFASMYATYHAYSCVDKENTDKFLGMSLESTNQLFDKIFTYYYDSKTEEELEDIKQKLSTISYIQVLRIRAKYMDRGYGMEKEEVEFCLKYLEDITKQLNTLEY